MEDKVTAVYELASEQQPEKLTEFYNDWVDNYDKDVLVQHTYTGPQAVATLISQLVQKKDARILDVGSGTGLVGEALAKEGFTNLWAVDPSAESLRVCREKGSYKETIESYVGPKPLPYDDNSFDGAASSGAFLRGHCDGSSLKDVIRLVKPGGHIVIATLKMSFYDERTNNTTLHGISMISEDLISKKVCFLEIKEFPAYADEEVGVLLKYTVM